MNTNLPIFAKKQTIIDSVMNYDVTIISAETGSGKSTQVPQYLYEAGYSAIVTEPRRIACVSLANRVADEMTQPQAVGYHTAFESTRTDLTDILYCTDGLQMARISAKYNKKDVLVIDEVHEWNLNIETLIAWVKLQLSTNGRRIKVVLMSATMETKQLEEYFKEVATVNVVSVPNKNFDVNWHFVGSNFELISKAAEAAKAGKNVLFFQPGKKEIDECISSLEDYCKAYVDVNIFAMHGELSLADQKRAFKHYDIPKIVVATNIAQTSITIDDIDVVCDTGMEKYISVVDGIEGLYMNNISKADCTQRAGRAGRTKVGEYYLLSSSVEFEDRIEYAVPEIQRLILDKVVLKLKSLSLDAEELDFFHKPSHDAIIAAKKSLRMMNAINRNGEITEIGKTMIRMPVNCRCARMLIEADCLDVVDDVLTIISIIESGSMINFKAQVEKEGFWGMTETRAARYSDFSKTTASDLIAELEIYNKIINFEIPNLVEAGINKKNFLQAKAMREKLEKSVSNYIYIREGDHNVSNIIRSLLSGMVENICEVFYGWAQTTVKNINGDSLKLSKNTVINSCQLAFGFPITIEYKDRHGYKTQISILQFNTALTAKMALEYIRPTMIEEEYVNTSISFNLEENRFFFTKNKKFKNIVIESITDSVSEEENPEEFAKLQEIWDSIPVEFKKETHVKVGPFIKKIEGYYTQIVNLTLEELSQIPEDLDRVSANGKFITFYCGYENNVSLKTLRYFITEREKQNKMNEFIDSLPKKTGKIEIITSWFDTLGEYHFEVFGEEKVIFTGLAKDKGSIFVGTFDSKEEADASTKEALQALVLREVQQNYPDKRFKIRDNNGRKIETKATKKAKDFFHENVHMVAEDVNTSNFSEDLAFLKEVFDEIQAELAE